MFLLCIKSSKLDVLMHSVVYCCTIDKFVIRSQDIKYVYCFIFFIVDYDAINKKPDD